MSSVQIRSPAFANPALYILDILAIRCGHKSGHTGILAAMVSAQHAARRLYDSIGAEAVHQFIGDRKQEYLHLDFISLHPGGDLPSADRRNFAKALSGFANSDGGVVVWGVRTSKVDNVDAAAQARPVENVHGVRSAFESLTGEAVSPIVDGVLHQELPIDGNSGFVKTYVPPSESGPHMAMCGEQRYYKRSGDSFYRMEHFDVADMFGRRAKPILECTYQLSSPNTRSIRDDGGAMVNVYNTSAVVRLGNNGRGIARYPSIELRVSESYPLPERTIDPRLSRQQSLRGDRAVVFAGGADVVIHIDSTIDVTAIPIHKIRQGSTMIDDLVVHYRIAAEGVAPVEGKLMITGGQILEVILEKFAES